MNKHLMTVLLVAAGVAAYELVGRQIVDKIKTSMGFDGDSDLI